MSDSKIAIPNAKPKSKLFGTRHVQIGLMFVSIIIFYAQRTSLSVAIIAMTEETPPDPSIPTYPKWDNTDIILSSFFWGYIVPQVGAGQLGEYFGPKWFLFTTMTIGSVFNILVPTMAKLMGPTGVIICRVVQGLNQGFLYPSTNNLISKWTPLYERSRVASFVFGGSNIGIVLSMIFTGALSGSTWGWPSAFYIYGALGIVWACIFAFFVANSPALHRSISDEEREYIESSNSCNTSENKKVPTPWRKIATSLPIWAVLITSCGGSWGGFTLLTEIPSYMSSIMGFDINSNSQLSALPYIAMFLVAMASAPLADKLISNKIFTIGTTRKIFNSLGTLIPAIALFSLGLIDSSQKDLGTALLVLAVGACGFVYSGYMVNLVDLAPNHAGTLLGITNGTSTIFSILGPLSVQFLGSDKKDPILWRKVFWLAAGIYVGCGLFYAIFCSGELQEWNGEEKEEGRKESNKCESENKEKSPV
ncbi:putative inorganic phosphate cotransporter [Tribolium madens]|uniref:putative inorganic phosphate cotransporter n=1 Tax=Tribolium madens TaxID=41895 RepID=UPI001CF7220D|nr:putative inorganic phosphate cotransporter [Tribolium madens]